MLQIGKLLMVFVGTFFFASLGFTMDKANGDENPSQIPKRKFEAPSDDESEEKEPKSKKMRLETKIVDTPELLGCNRVPQNLQPTNYPWFLPISNFLQFPESRTQFAPFQNTWLAQHLPSLTELHVFMPKRGNINYEYSNAFGFFSSVPQEKLDKLITLEIQLHGVIKGKDLIIAAAKPWIPFLTKAINLHSVKLSFNIASLLLPYIKKGTHVIIDCNGIVSMNDNVAHHRQEDAEKYRENYLAYCGKKYPKENGYNITVLPIKEF